MNVVDVLNDMGDQLSTYEGNFQGEYLFGDINDLHFNWRFNFSGLELYGLSLDSAVLDLANFVYGRQVHGLSVLQSMREHVLQDNELKFSAAYILMLFEHVIKTIQYSVDIAVVRELNNELDKAKEDLKLEKKVAVLVVDQIDQAGADWIREGYESDIKYLGPRPSVEEIIEAVDLLSDGDTLSSFINYTLYRDLNNYELLSDFAEECIDYPTTFGEFLLERDEDYFMSNLSNFTNLHVDKVGHSPYTTAVYRESTSIVTVSDLYGGHYMYSISLVDEDGETIDDFYIDVYNPTQKVSEFMESLEMIDSVSRDEYDILLLDNVGYIDNDINLARAKKVETVKYVKVVE